MIHSGDSGTGARRASGKVGSGRGGMRDPRSGGGQQQVSLEAALQFSLFV